MNKIGYGLLDRSMIHRMTEKWHYGGVGVLILHLPSPDAVQDAIGDWVSCHPCIIWRYRVKSDFYFFLQRDKTDERLDRLVSDAARDLRQAVEKALPDSSRPFAIGTSVVYPSGIGMSAEAMIYHALKEAVVSVIRDGMQIETPGEAAEHSASAEPGPADWHQPFPIGALAKPIPVFAGSARVSEVSHFFESNPRVQGAVVAHEERPVGIVMKEKLHQLLAGQFGLSLYWNRAIEKLMDRDALVVDSSLPVEQVAQLAMARDISRLYDVVTITRDGKLLGAASIRSILECMTNLRTEEARSANPLTGLPGNAAIHREMKQRIDAGKSLSIIYADLDYFKWFNDCFGFSQGDELIRFLAKVLQDALHACGDKKDFIGHIGGDDFILITEAVPVPLCRLIIERFDEGVKSFYEGKGPLAVTDRTGKRMEQEGVSVSLSLLRWDGVLPVTPDGLAQAAARLKKEAKSRPGSTYAVGDVTVKHLREER